MVETKEQYKHNLLITLILNYLEVIEEKEQIIAEKSKLIQDLKRLIRQLEGDKNTKECPVKALHKHYKNQYDYDFCHRCGIDLGEFK